MFTGSANNIMPWTQPEYGCSNFVHGSAFCGGLGYYNRALLIKLVYSRLAHIHKLIITLIGVLKQRIGMST